MNRCVRSAKPEVPGTIVCAHLGRKRLSPMVKLSTVCASVCGGMINVAAGTVTTVMTVRKPMISFADYKNRPRTFGYRLATST